MNSKLKLCLHWTNTDIVSYNCGKNGHHARNCPSKKGYVNTTIGDENNDVDNEGVSDKHIFHQTGGNLSKVWVLLDN